MKRVVVVVELSIDTDDAVRAAEIANSAIGIMNNTDWVKSANDRNPVSLKTGTGFIVNHLDNNPRNTKYLKRNLLKSKRALENIALGKPIGIDKTIGIDKPTKSSRWNKLLDWTCGRTVDVGITVVLSEAARKLWELYHK